ncbi:MAG TPA: UvrD-helicase domain-containing protein, partial [Verrucomicrobiae bacterium]|nr:UvrD-helicase domain-containing protein [Verrucomicrobiae bacterium]
MPFYADLHVHSKYARATSRDLDLEHMGLWAAKKGVTVLGTGDFTHPKWFAEINEKLAPAEPGLFRLKPELERWCADQFPTFAQQPTRFLLEVEISTIYKKGDKTRKVHHLHYVPDLTSAQRFIAKLSRIGNLNADGRPILGLDSRDLLEITLEAGEGAYLIPAHIWTPWFAVLGSKSGFDSIEECYGDLTKHIFALETGLSSDPPMNWRLRQLDPYTLVSNSDAHSPGKIGREACKFDCALDYWAIRNALETGRGYGGSVEFFPEEGKYHLDGHRTCGVCLDPEQTKKHGGLCPTCGKELTVGVMHRVNELADRPEGGHPEAAAPFRSLVPLSEVLSEIHRVGVSSRKVAESYEKLVSRIGSELFILEHAPVDELRQAGSELLAEGIRRMREGRVIRQAGYDGEYGVIRVFTDHELDRSGGVSFLIDVPVSKAKAESGAAAAREVERGAPIPRDDKSELASVRVDSEAGGLRESAAAFCNDTPPLPFSSDLLVGLDHDQRAAAEIVDGPLMIIAGPGTGKTRTLTHRIAHLITNRHIPAEQVLAITFTNRAANEMKERLHSLLPVQAQAVLVTTFHGLCYRLLREHGGRLGLPATLRIASEEERRALLVEQLKLTVRKAERWLKRISKSKMGPDAAGEPIASRGSRDLPEDETSIVLAAYEKAMRRRGWIDFDDLIGLSLELLERHPDVAAQCRERFPWVSVDEFQDMDTLQYELIKRLVPPNGNLCAIGDPDQAIYGFRGAEPRLFLRFVSDYPAAGTVHLHRNYRSGRGIVEGALQAIAPGSLVEGRVLEALNADPTRITIHESPTDKAEAEFVVHRIEKLIGGSGFFSLDSGRVNIGERCGAYSFSDFAVLYRTDAQAEALCEALVRSGIPFQRHSHRPLIEHPAVQAVLESARAMPAEQPVEDRLKEAASCQNRREEALTSNRHSTACRPPSSEPPYIGCHSLEQFI